MRLGLCFNFRQLIRSSFLGLALGAGMLLCGSGTARAEWVADAFFGIPFPRGGEVVGDRAAANSFPADVDIDVDVTFGFRFGRFAMVADWLDLGVQIDASGTLGELGAVDFNYVPVTAMLMARFPILADEDLPMGRIQPYFGGGPSLVWSELNQNVYRDTTLSAGVGVATGIKVMVIKQFGIFAEYRFNYFDAEYEDRPEPYFVYGHVHAKPVVHTPTIGVSWHFDLPSWQ